MRKTHQGKLSFAKRHGTNNEGKIVADEEDAITVISAQNWITRLEKIEAREAARKAEIRSKITLPKLKFMGDV